MPLEQRRGELSAGDRFGHFRLESVLGEGGMGIVFGAVREPDEQLVALKLLKQQLSSDEMYKARFRHEARAAGEIAHAHLVPIVEAGEVDGRHYVASVFYAGGTLQQRVESEGQLPLTDVVRVVREIGGALDSLHAAELVHRDVKPSNVMLDKVGATGLTDFGLAKGPAYTVLTRPGQVMGTVDYIAPELITGEPASPASDIYALGCLVYECLAGAPPFDSDNLFETVSMHLEEEPAALGGFRSDLPEGFSTAVLTAMAKEPEKRPTTARAYSLMLAVGAR
jgi:serine/threonine kinase PknH